MTFVICVKMVFVGLKVLKQDIALVVILIIMDQRATNHVHVLMELVQTGLMVMAFVYIAKPTFLVLIATNHVPVQELAMME